MTDLYLTIASVMAVCICLLWAASLITGKVSFVDSFWGAAFVIVTWTAVLSGPGLDTLSLPQTLLLGMVTAWGTRLAVYLGGRFLREGEDRRYIKIMGDLTGVRWALKALLFVFTMQSVLILLVSLPIVTLLANPASEPTVLTWIAVTVWGTGFAFEVIADRQLKLFKSNPDNHGKVLDSGVWGWSRHPNYFGEALVWWGIWLMSPSIIGLVSPIFVTFTLLKLSGVPLAEAGMKRSKPGYEAYQQTVSPFVPLPPKSKNG